MLSKCYLHQGHCSDLCLAVRLQCPALSQRCCYLWPFKVSFFLSLRATSPVVSAQAAHFLTKWANDKLSISCNSHGKAVSSGAAFGRGCLFSWLFLSFQSWQRLKHVTDAHLCHWRVFKADVILTLMHRPNYPPFKPTTTDFLRTEL